LELTIIQKRNKRAKEIKDTLPKEGKRLLNYIDYLPSKIGAPPFEADEEWLIIDIAKFVVDNYRFLMDHDRIPHAFDMAASGKLLDDKLKPIRISTYGQKMSCNVVGEVLTAYHEMLKRDAARPKMVSQRQIEAPKSTMTDKDAYDLLVAECEKEGKLPELFFLWKSVYKYLKEINAFDSWSDAEKNALKAQAKVMTPKKSGHVISVIKEENKKGEIAKLKELCVKKYFKESVLNGNKK
jgi:hypothetical protein